MGLAPTQEERQDRTDPLWPQISHRNHRRGAPHVQPRPKILREPSAPAIVTNHFDNDSDPSSDLLKGELILHI
jgi:hypothetical protein